MGTHSQPVVHQGVTYPSKRAAALALTALGMKPADIAAATGSTKIAVEQALKVARRRADQGEPAGIVQSGWTEAKVDKAVRLFGLCLDEVGRQLAVPVPELSALWLKGKKPQLAPAPEPEPDREDDEAELAALDAVPTHCMDCDEPLTGEYMLCGRTDEPFAGARCRPCFDKSSCCIAHGDDCSTLVAPPSQAEVPLVPARFPDPPPAPTPAEAPSRPMAAKASAGDVRLIDETGRFLHESLDGMTTNPRFAWKGDLQKLKVIQNRMPHLRQLDTVPA